MNDDKTVVEQLDAAQSGEEFGQVLMGLFDALAQARDRETPPNTRRDNPSYLCGCGCKCPCGCWTCADGYHCAGDDCPHEDGRRRCSGVTGSGS